MRYAKMYKMHKDDSKNKEVIDDLRRLGIAELKEEYPTLEGIDDILFVHKVGLDEDDFVNNKMTLRIEVNV